MERYHDACGGEIMSTFGWGGGGGIMSTFGMYSALGFSI